VRRRPVSPSHADGAPARRQVEFGLPDLEGRASIFQIHARSMNCERDIRFELLARLCPNTTGADIRSVCIEAGMYAIRARRKTVTEKDMIEAVNKVIKGYSKFSATPKSRRARIETGPCTLPTADRNVVACIASQVSRIQLSEVLWRLLPAHSFTEYVRWRALPCDVRAQRVVSAAYVCERGSRRALGCRPGSVLGRAPCPRCLHRGRCVKR
jgi:hypothetical protein